MILEVRLLTNKTPAEAHEVIFNLSEWTRDNKMTLESAFDLYCNDIKQHGEPNITATAFISV